MGDELMFYLNGQKVVEASPDATETIAHYVRDKAKLTGTKLSCGIGACGACTVMVSEWVPSELIVKHRAVNGCLTSICSLHGKALTTVEGVGSIRTQLHDVQKRLVESNGTQCGYCTPGFIMSMYTLLRNDPVPSMQNIEDALKGNICRCTGYRSILEGFGEFSVGEGCSMGDACCQKKEDNQDKKRVVPTNIKKKAKAPLDRMEKLCTQELIFPPELQLKKGGLQSTVVFKSDSTTWHQPVTLKELLRFKTEKPKASLVANLCAPARDGKIFISSANVAELKVVELATDGVTVGAGVTMTQLEQFLEKLINNENDEKYQGFKALVDILQWNGTRQWKNIATIGDQIGSRKATSDLNVLLTTYKATVICESSHGMTNVLSLNADFFNPNKSPFEDEEVIVSIFIPFLPENTVISSFREPIKKAMGSAILSAGLRVTLEKDSNQIIDSTFVFGGSSLDQTSIATLTSAHIAGSVWDEHLPEVAIAKLEEELYGQESKVPTHNRILASSIFYKFYITTLWHLKQSDFEANQTAMEALTPEPAKPVKVYEPDLKEGEIGVGHPIPHVSSKQQTTGEALYVNDIPHCDGELFMAFVLSSKAHAKINNVDVSVALGMPGVTDYIDYHNVPGSNSTGYYIAKDEEIFASDEVHHVGTIIGGILATSEKEARAAVKKVVVDYEEFPYILTIEEAIEAESYFDFNHTHRLGEAEEEMANCQHIVEGSVSIGGQLHFYAEPNVCLVKPGENYEMEIFCPNHSLDSLQGVVAGALNVPKNKLYMKTKRIGGSFGGKDSNSRRIVLPVAVAAYKHQKPVRCVFQRDEDTTIIGGRHPMLATYKLGFKPNGKLHALIADLYSNGGSSIDNSEYVLDWAMLQGDGAYYCPNVLWRGHVCKTNIRSPAGFRGYGGPQGAFFYKTLINHVAAELGKPLERVQETNLYVDGSLTPYHQTMTDTGHLHRCWKEIKNTANFNSRKAAIEIFNRENRTRKKGIAMEAVKYGIGAATAFLAQGAALVNVYNDGSVLLAHAGVEMGQGLHTKMIQVASQVLNIPIERIYVNENNSAVVPNPLPTISSCSSDQNGLAVMEACDIILSRLAPYKESNPDGTWEQWVAAAFYTRTNLSAVGYGRVPGVYNFDWSDPASTPPFRYFTNGAMCSEVEVDLLTGTYLVRRIDIVMDVGQSLNPAIDVGQIEGAFVQGMGWHTTEEENWSDDGKLLSTNYDKYTVPKASDIPSEFNVTLLKDSENPKAVYSSKGIGEPGILGASSVLFALQEALVAALRDAGHLERPIISETPFTAEKVRKFLVEHGIVPIQQ